MTENLRVKTTIQLDLKPGEEKIEFPPNKLGLKRGSMLISNHPQVEEQLGVKVGDIIPIGYDGEYVRSNMFTWSLEQLIEEIEAGYWKISERFVDLDSRAKDDLFKFYVEGRSLDYL